MHRQPAKPAIPNPLLQREPELVQRLAIFRGQVNDMLADKLAGQMLNDPAFRLKECPHPLADVKATAIILRVLTRDSWDEDDLRLFDACWRQAAASELFGDEFEAERLRIQQAGDVSRKALPTPELCFCLICHQQEHLYQQSMI